MSFSDRPSPAPSNWGVYGLDDSWTGEVFLRGFMRSGPGRTGWWPDHFHLVHGPRWDHNAAAVHVVSSPHLGETALQTLHSGLAQAGFGYGMSGTGHVSGCPTPPERITLPIDGTVVEVDAWRGERAEAAWIETADTWVAVTASKLRLDELGLTRIEDLGPLLAARNGGRQPSSKR